MKRCQIQAKIKSKQEKIKQLRTEIIELNRQDALLSDRNRQFVEDYEDVLVSNRPKKYEHKLVGRVHWKEKFYDEDTNECIVIERKRIVRINGEWQ